MDYYNILEVPNSATTSDIRAAYRRLALKWHPDKNLDNQEEATEKFQQISQAYQVLSDEVRRRAYDNSQKTTGFDWKVFFDKDFSFRSPEDIFSDFFGRDPIPAESRKRRHEGTVWNSSGVGSIELDLGPLYYYKYTSSKKIEDGKRIETTKVTKNGVETTRVYENDVLISETERDLDSKSFCCLQ